MRAIGLHQLFRRNRRFMLQSWPFSSRFHFRRLISTYTVEVKSWRSIIAGQKRGIETVARGRSRRCQKIFSRSPEGRVRRQKRFDPLLVFARKDGTGGVDELAAGLCMAGGIGRAANPGCGAARPDGRGSAAISIPVAAARCRCRCKAHPATPGRNGHAPERSSSFAPRW